MNFSFFFFLCVGEIYATTMKNKTVLPDAYKGLTKMYRKSMSIKMYFECVAAAPARREGENVPHSRE